MGPSMWPKYMLECVACSTALPSSYLFDHSYTFLSYFYNYVLFIYYYCEVKKYISKAFGLADIFISPVPYAYIYISARRTLNELLHHYKFIRYTANCRAKTISKRYFGRPDSTTLDLSKYQIFTKASPHQQRRCVALRKHSIKCAIKPLLHYTYVRCALRAINITRIFTDAIYIDDRFINQHLLVVNNSLCYCQSNRALVCWGHV